MFCFYYLSYLCKESCCHLLFKQIMNNPSFHNCLNLTMNVCRYVWSRVSFFSYVHPQPHQKDSRAHLLTLNASKKYKWNPDETFDKWKIIWEKLSKETDFCLYITIFKCHPHKIHILYIWNWIQLAIYNDNVDKLCASAN